jgi:uncharacterized repeat protein (TIGR03803 family)
MSEKIFARRDHYRRNAVLFGLDVRLSRFGQGFVRRFGPSMAAQPSAFILSAIALFATDMLGSADAAPMLQTLYNFSDDNDGANPNPGLIIDQSGTIYGTTFSGGPCCGTVFELTPPSAAGGTWTENVLFGFGASPSYPVHGLISNKVSGAIYGVTSSFSADSAVFNLTPPATAGGTWTENNLVRFDDVQRTSPAPIVSDASGAIYTSDTEFGVTGNYITHLFKLTPPTTAGGTWTSSVIYTFGQTNVGDVNDLIFSADGALYGTTDAGGTLNEGMVFQLTPPSTTGGSWTEATPHSFAGSDGAGPLSLVFGGDGALYGTTDTGGALNKGTVFKLTPPSTAGGTWMESVLYSFSGTDGSFPNGLIFAGDGALYGTTDGGGALDKGTVFKLTPPSIAGGTWVESVLYSFSGTDGSFPNGLIFGADGALYGVTDEGGAFGFGTVFQLVIAPLQSRLGSGDLCNGVFNGVFNGNVTVSAGQNCVFVGGGINGHVRVTGGNLGLTGAVVGGNVSVLGGTFAFGARTTIGGNVFVHNLPVSAVQSSICGTTVRGNISVDNDGSPLEIGSAAPQFCAGNTISGSLRVTNSLGPVLLLNNKVGGSLGVAANSGPLDVVGNTVTKALTCVANTDVILSGPNSAGQIQGQCH